LLSNIPSIDVENRPCRGKKPVILLSRSALLLGLLLGLLPGCRRENGSAQVQPIEGKVEYLNVDPLKDPNRFDAVTDVTTGQKLAPVSPGPLPVSSVSSVVNPDPGGIGQTSADGHTLHLNYYSGYAHVYWRLNWIRKTIIKGSLPHDFARSISITRRELEDLTRTISRDGNYTVADRALTHLESGLEHLRADQALQEASAAYLSAPWSGRLVMQNYIDQGGMGFGGRPLGMDVSRNPRHYDSDSDTYTTRPVTNTLPVPSALSSAQRSALAIALEYADRYHAAPLDQMRSEWRLAIEEINRLRDQLWLMNRPENSDGNASEVRPTTGQTRLDPSHGVGSFSQTTLYNKAGTDLPPAFGKEPANPFRETPAIDANAAEKAASKKP
jgi:hypothetical protein